MQNFLGIRSGHRPGLEATLYPADARSSPSVTGALDAMPWATGPCLPLAAVKRRSA